jgi:tRNA U34 2-thiouridine synthase MnmA/TrmU
VLKHVSLQYAYYNRAGHYVMRAPNENKKMTHHYGAKRVHTCSHLFLSQLALDHLLLPNGYLQVTTLSLTAISTSDKYLAYACHDTSTGFDHVSHAQLQAVISMSTLDRFLAIESPVPIW